jgi:hypothetical protein
LVSFAVMGAPFGNFLASITGSNMNLIGSSITYFIPCIALIILLIFLPDSPHYLVQFGNIEEARKSIKWYRSNEKVEEELEEVIKFVKSTATTSFIETLGIFYCNEIIIIIIYPIL